jgi:hypothetical protein
MGTTPARQLERTRERSRLAWHPVEHTQRATVVRSAASFHRPTDGRCSPMASWLPHALARQNGLGQQCCRNRPAQRDTAREDFSILNSLFPLNKSIEENRNREILRYL